MKQALLVALLLFCCAPPQSPYRPMRDGKGVGYKDTRVKDDVYIVEFQGTPRISEEKVDYYTIYRLAELTLEKGYKYFLVFDESRGGDSFQFTMPGKLNIRDSGYGKTTGSYSPPQTFTFKRFTSRAAIRLLNEIPPDYEEAIFDAEWTKLYTGSLLWGEDYHKTQAHPTKP